MVEIQGRYYLKFGDHPHCDWMIGNAIGNKNWYQVYNGLDDMAWDRNVVPIDEIHYQGVGNGRFSFSVFTERIRKEDIYIDNPVLYGIFGKKDDNPLYIGGCYTGGEFMPSVFRFESSANTRNLIIAGSNTCKHHNCEMFLRDDGEFVCPDCNQR